MWAGKPNAMRLAVQNCWMMFLVVIPWSAIVFVALDDALKDALRGEPSIVLIVLIPFVAVAFVILVGNPTWQYWKGLRTIYAVTSQRLLILNGIFGSTVESYFPPFDVERQQRRDGSGTVIFAREVRRHDRWRFQGVRLGSHVNKIGFFHIPDVRLVEGYILELQEKSERNGPED